MSGMLRRPKPKPSSGWPCGVRQKAEPAICLPVRVPGMHEEVLPWAGRELMSNRSIIVYGLLHGFFFCNMLLVIEVRP